ncbi:DUF3017 domain-containing protein [Flexivirga meconopsidis]|uniref:DUF3017 domain-containing protein n=1 Tax=Flexivirga meconopsidis TaxID=2977121 RepID=UPI0022406270
MTPFRLGPLWWLLAVGCVVALGVLTTTSVRAGGYLLAGCLAAAGLLRIYLPEKAVGALVIRSRMVDGVFFFTLAAAVAFIFSIVKLGGLPG